MSKSTFVYVTYIRSTPDKVFKALTDPEITRQYWGHNTIIRVAPFMACGYHAAKKALKDVFRIYIS